MPEFGETAKNSSVASDRAAPLTRFFYQGLQPAVLTFKPADSQTVDPFKENGVPNNAVC